jgi:hypothetical protein
MLFAFGLSLLRFCAFGPAETSIVGSRLGLGRTSARIVNTPNDVTKADKWSIFQELGGFFYRH